MRIVRDERGLTIIELIVAITGMLAVAGAALTVLTSFERNSRDAGARADSQQFARTQLELLSRQLRNLASPTYEDPDAIDKAEPYDLVFKTIDARWRGSSGNAANVYRVRYCLDSTNGRILQQEQRWSSQAVPAAPSSATCPDGGWGGHRAVAVDVRNRHGGQERPVFLYDTTTAAEVTRVRASLFVDTDPARDPKETQLSSGVFLRNQNRPPTANFTATVNGAHILLNASISSDPEGEPLTYVWYDGTTKIGEGVTFDYVPAGGSSTRTISLRVYDSAGLEGISSSQTVTVTA